MDGNAKTTGDTYTFSVTLKDRSKEIVRADFGTPICDQLLQKAMDGETLMSTENHWVPTINKKAPELQKNFKKIRLDFFYSLNSIKFSVS